MELALLLQLVLLQLELTPLPAKQQEQRRKQQQQPVNAAHQAQSSLTPAAGLAGQTPPFETAAVAASPPNTAAEASVGLPFGLATLIPRWLRQQLLDTAVFGLGACGGSSRQEQQWLGSGMRAAGGAAGYTKADRAGVPLPGCELRRLVGFKVPAGPWWVTVTATV